MKRIILFFSLLVLCSTTLAMEIGIIKEFENRRPALGRFKVEGNTMWDFDRDGIPEISVHGDSVEYVVIHPVSKEILWSFDTRILGGGGATAQLIGYLDMAGQNVTSHAFFVDAFGTPMFVNVDDNKVDYFIQNATPIAVLERPDNGKQIIAVELDAGRKVVLIGDTGGSNTAGSIASDGSGQLHSAVSDYQLELKFQAEPGLTLAYDPDLFDPRHDMDIDGDERMDIPMIIEDPAANNEPIGVVVRGGDNFDVLWQFPFPAEHKENILKGFFGFVDANGDGEKDAILGENVAVTLDGTVHVIAENFVTLDVHDIDGDGFEDIIGLNTVDSTVVIYGATTATLVAGTDPAAIHFRLFQNYPNPFNPSTTISYSVAKAGEVELTVYNQLGQTVRSLFSGHKVAGEYSLNWDGRDDTGRFVSSGQYFYRLKVEEVAQSRRMLFLK